MVGTGSLPAGPINQEGFRTGPVEALLPPMAGPEDSEMRQESVFNVADAPTAEGL